MLKNCIVCDKRIGPKSLYTCAEPYCKSIWQTLPKVERTCARLGCGTTFLLGGDKRKRYCSRSCAAMVNNQGINRWSHIASASPSSGAQQIQPRTKLVLPLCPSCGNKHRNKLLCSSCQVPTPFENLSISTLRKLVIAEQNNSCNGCGLDVWLGRPMTLELDHKDGNRENNVRENLEALCPNCHSQTDTWRGRNKSRKRASDEQIAQAIKTTPSLYKALISLGLSPKGSNYVRIRRIAKDLGGSVGFEPAMWNLRSQVD